MKKNAFTIIMASLAILLGGSSAAAEKANTVIANRDAVLGKYEKNDRVFKKLKIGNVVSYFHRRKIGEAIVEKDFIRYRIDADTQALIEKKVRWRKGLPETVIPMISKEQAERMVGGVVQFTRLYIISPDSVVFPIKPTPKNPCWVVRSIAGKKMIVTIIDAISGKKLGHGMPPPYTGFSLYGPDWGECDPEPSWRPLAENAETWFEEMGYDTEVIACPSTSAVQSRIQSDSIAMFYETAHGYSSAFHHICPDEQQINSIDIATWIASYASMPFTFLASCDGMCETGQSYFSHEFRKGSVDGTVTIGFCHMSGEQCADCFVYELDWQDRLFSQMAAGFPVLQAFERANQDFPDCAEADCMRIAGDTGLRVVPVVTRSLCGSVYDGQKGPLTLGSRDHYIRCDVDIPSGQTLTILPNVELVFLNDSKIIADGTLSADGAGGEIRLFSEEYAGFGMEFTGTLEVMDGGGIKIY